MSDLSTINSQKKLIFIIVDFYFKKSHYFLSLYRNQLFFLITMIINFKNRQKATKIWGLGQTIVKEYGLNPNVFII